MFDIIIPDDRAKTFQGKSVEFVCKTFNNSFFGKFPSWRGSLENEFFTLCFVAGELEVSVSECEFYLGDPRFTTTYAHSRSMRDLEKPTEGMDAEETLRIYQKRIEYFQTIGQIEQESVSLSDIMVVLNWTYAKSAKVDEDIVNEPCLSSFSS